MRFLRNYNIFQKSTKYSLLGKKLEKINSIDINQYWTQSLKTDHVTNL